MKDETEVGSKRAFFKG